ncbi:MAG: primase protein [Candidatus Roizmanbacteria bacterium GW2011_GWA2_35_19]|uniref:DNA primase n=1 Tax=Candidatus Roizmanbacteria bacterium GW2011_GWA2_35_19 TaxID=1618478 RepID=A0A0G0BNZ7_9BACT|nr:MAG: primase protein [Candidatus Roizmanbacteria bacterium GW2011_GWA2_35_19]
MTMDSPIDEIKKKLDLVEFISSYITLKKLGRNFKANCPFHNEKTPSFVVSPERQIWHCFGSCGEGGDIVKFLMKWENITFFEALKELAKKAGITLKNSNLEDSTWKKKERFFNMNRLAAEFFQYVLNKTKFGKKGEEYLKDRQIKPSIIEKFMLGYSPSSWDSLRLFLKKKNFSDQEMHENGLLVLTDSARYYDRFRGRLMFPLCDARDHILGFSGRSLEDNVKEAKYINTPETPIYHKRETLFGINLARESIKKEKNVFLVEGEFDMITPYQNGFSNFVAIKGSAVTSEQLMLLKRYTEKLTLALDADEAGNEAVKRGIDEAERLEFEINVIKFDFAKDPDEAVRKDLVAFKKAISKPIHIYDFLIDLALKKHPADDPFNKKKVGDEVLPYIAKINNSIVKSHYLKKISALLDVTEYSLETLIKKINRSKNIQSFYKPTANNKKNEKREDILEKYVLSSIFQSENAYKINEIIFSIIDPSDLSIPSHKKIVSIFIEKKELFKNGFNINLFVTFLSPELRAIFDEIYLFASSDLIVSNENLEKLAFELKRFSLKRQMNQILNEENDEKEKNKKLLLITEELKEVEKKLISL